jgi:hypothetical protein
MIGSFPSPRVEELKELLDSYRKWSVTPKSGAGQSFEADFP